MSKFKVGDIVRATTNNYRFTTIDTNWVGEVTKTGYNSFVAKTIFCDKIVEIGEEVPVLDYDDFELVENETITLKCSPRGGFNNVENLISKNVWVYDKTNYKIKGIYPNEKKKLVVVKFDDDSVIKVKCSKEDEFDVYVGVALAYSYKQCGSNTKFRKMVDKLIGGTKNGKQ